MRKDKRNQHGARNSIFSGKIIMLHHYVFPCIVDIVILNTAPPHLKHHIIKTGSLIFDRNRKLRVKFVAHTILEYLDYRPIEDVCLRAVSGRFRRGAVGKFSAGP